MSKNATKHFYPNVIFDIIIVTNLSCGNIDIPTKNVSNTWKMYKIEVLIANFNIFFLSLYHLYGILSIS